MDEIQVTIYTSTDSDDVLEILDRITDEILRPSFEDDEFPSDKSLADGFEDGQVVGVASSPAKGVLGVAVADSPNADGLALFSYLATSPNSRGSGVGGVLVEAMRAHWASEDVGLVLGEVHDPRVHEETETEHPEARVRFYSRHGAEVLGVPWVQPAIGAGSGRVEGMLLITLHRSGDYVGDSIDSATIRRWALDYYRSSAGEESGMLPSSLDDRLTSAPQMDVWPIDEYAKVALLSP
ncbi:MAG: hypothetical protein R2735_16010 [Microthrixaceae bacterium]